MISTKVEQALKRARVNFSNLGTGLSVLAESNATKDNFGLSQSDLSDTQGGFMSPVLQDDG